MLHHEVVCDASGMGLGAVLIQDGRPISFWAKRLSEAEQNYAVSEQEMLAVVHALELWHCYLDGQDFTVVTDHSPNVFFANKKLLNPWQKRCNERIQPYKFEWEYRPGRINVADPLSRHPSFFAESSTVAAALRLKTAGEYVQGCLVCQRDKASNQKPAGLLQPIEIPYNSWDHATMDRITQLSKTKHGHTAILVVVDKLTKMTRFAPVRNESTAADIAQAFVEHVWNSHGMPLQITTDRGTEFTNAFSKSLCKIIGTRHTKSTSYHPQTDGQTERMNRVLEDMLRHYNG